MDGSAMETGSQDLVTFTEKELFTQFADEFEESMKSVSSDDSSYAVLQCIKKTINNMFDRQKAMYQLLKALKQELNSSRLDTQKCLKILERVFDNGPHNEESQSLLQDLEDMKNPEHLRGVEFVKAECSGVSKTLILPPGTHSKILSTDNMRTVVREILLALHPLEFLCRCTLTGDSKKRKSNAVRPSEAKVPRDSQDTADSQDVESEASYSELDSSVGEEAVQALPHETFELILAAINKKMPLQSPDDTKRRRKDVREAITQSLQYLKLKNSQGNRNSN